MTGLRWANPGGEALALDTDRFIAVDGIDEVIDILSRQSTTSWKELNTLKRKPA